MLKCRDVLVQADAYLADELTSWQRVSFRVHLGLCRHCRHPPRPAPTPPDRCG